MRVAYVNVNDCFLNLYRVANIECFNDSEEAENFSCFSACFDMFSSKKRYMNMWKSYRSSGVSCEQVV